MNFNIEDWTTEHLQKLRETFGTRLEFVGLQGSFGRGEATPDSDIDMVIILDRMEESDLRAYRKLVQTMPEHGRACGFFSGKEELRAWPRYDLWTLYYDTKTLYGNLTELLPELCRDDLREAVLTGAAGLYHMAVHARIHSDNPETFLRDLYKATFFIARAKYQFETDEYVPSKTLLATRLTGTDKEIIDRAVAYANGMDESTPENDFGRLIAWLQELIKRYGRI